MNNSLVLILDFGAQYSQLIARRIREANVYCEIVPYNYSLDKIKAKAPKGIILSGGPMSVNDNGAPKPEAQIYTLGIPVLGICYGGQLICQHFDGVVTKASSGEYGKTAMNIRENAGIFADLSDSITCWMSHFDYIEQPPTGFTITASTDTCPVAAMRSNDGTLQAIQFHPEVEHTEKGSTIIQNFLYDVCKIVPDWTMGNFVNDTVTRLKEQIGNRKAICALSGGVDSSVVAMLVHKAIGRNLICVFVDHGLMRKNEAAQIEEMFGKQFDMELITVNAQERFLGKLQGVTDPERKRKIIGEEFIRVFEEEKQKIGHVDFLVQGTIYPDVIESGTNTAAVIKSHHNVGGLPDDIDFEIVEPIRQLFKDEVRKVGKELGLPDHLINRQPFPGPGLAIRILGEITPEKLEIVREADHIFREEIRLAGLENQIWQYFAALPNIRSVGVMGDERTYSHAIVLRAVTSTDGMTSDWAKIPYAVLETISNKIVNQVRNVNRVFYDITTKPPATIEFE